MNEHDDEFLYTLRADLPDDFARDLYARLQAMEQQPMQFNPTLNGHPTTYPQTRQRRTSPLIALTAACAALVMCGLVLAFVPQNKDPFAQELPITHKDTVEITDQNVDSLQSIMTLGNGSVQDIALSPDGTTLAVAGSTGIHLHDADDLNAPTILFGDAKINTYDIKYSPDGTILAGIRDEALYIWDPATAEVKHKIKERVTKLLRFSADSTRIAGIAVKVEPLSYEIGVWDTATGELLNSLPLADDFNLFTLKLDGNLDRVTYTMNTNYGDMTLTSLSGAYPEETLKGDSYRAALSEDGRWLVKPIAMGSSNFEAIDLLDPARPATRLAVGNGNYVSSVRFLPNSTTLAIVTQLGLYLADFSGEEPVITENFPLDTFLSVFDPIVEFNLETRRFALLSGSIIKIWAWGTTDGERVQPITEYQGYDPNNLQVTFNPSGTKMLSFSVDGYQPGAAREWDLTTDQPAASLLLDEDEEWQYVLDAEYVDDNQVVYMGQREPSNQAGIIKMTSGEVLMSPRGTPHEALVLGLDADNTVMTGNQYWIVRYPQGEQAQRIQVESPGSSPETRSTLMLPGPFSPDGRLMPANVCLEYAPSQDGFMDQCIRGAVHLWDTTTGKVTAIFSENTATGGFQMVFSPDSRFLIADQCVALEQVDFSGYDYNMCTQYEIVVWDLSTIEAPDTPLQPVATLEHENNLSGFAISPRSTPDNLLLAGADFTELTFWQIKPAAGEITPLRTVRSIRPSLTFNPAGTLLVASGYGLIELWGTAEQ